MIRNWCLKKGQPGRHTLSAGLFRWYVNLKEIIWFKRCFHPGGLVAFHVDTEGSSIVTVSLEREHCFPG